jgi:hypothetical protein
MRAREGRIDVKKGLIWAGIGVGILFLAAIGLAIWFSFEGWWPVVVDIVICVTAIISLLVLILLAAAVFYLTITLLGVKRELMPVLDSLKSTSQTVSETARVAGDLGVAPTVRTASVLVGAAEAAGVILGRGQVQTRARKRAQRRQEVERELLARGELNGHRG